MTACKRPQQRPAVTRPHPPRCGSTSRRWPSCWPARPVQVSEAPGHGLSRRETRASWRTGRVAAGRVLYRPAHACASAGAAPRPFNALGMGRRLQGEWQRLLGCGKGSCWVALQHRCAAPPSPTRSLLCVSRPAGAAPLAADRPCMACCHPARRWAGGRRWDPAARAASWHIRSLHFPAHLPLPAPAPHPALPALQQPPSPAPT